MISTIIKKPVTVMIVFTLLVALGIFCGTNLSLDMFPNTNNPSVMVMTTCANADPSEVEHNVTRKLESAFSGLSGLKHMTSESSTGYSQIILEFSGKTDMDSAMNDVREKIDRARGDLPELAGNPNAIQLDASLISLMTLVMKGDHSPSELYGYADDIVAPSLEQIDGIASCDIYGGEEKCILVSVSLDRLEAYSLSLSQVRQSLSSQNLESSAGIISAGKTNYTVSTDGAFHTLEDVGNTVVAYKKPYSGGDAQPIFLRDIADISEDSKDVHSVAYLDGVPCIMFTLQKQGGRNSVAAAHAVRKALPSILAQLPDDIEIIETANNTDIIESTVHEVISSVVTGALLAIVVLFLFLRNFKSTLIIGISIPVSIIITLVFMYFRGTSLNLISLSGLLLGVGMLVDNSIVVLENVCTHTAKGESPLDAALNGAKEMVMPVISSTLTSVCIFVPMLAFGSLIGIIGEAFLDLGFAISISLICSLFTSIILVPVLAGYYLKVNPKSVLQESLVESSGNVGSIGSRIYSFYAGIVRWLLHHKIVSFVFLIVLFVVAMLSLPNRGFILLPSNPETQVKIEMTLAKGTSLEETEEQLKELEKLALEGVRGVTFSNVSVGGTSAASSNTGTLLLSLSGAYSDEAKDILRTYFDRFPDAQFEFQATSLSLSSGFGGGSGGYSLEMHSNNMDILSKTAEEIATLIKDKAGDIVSEVSSDILSGMPEVKIHLDREAMNALGLSVNAISTELRAAVSGVEAGTFEQDGKDTDIVVTLDKSDKQKVSDLSNIFVTNQSGERIPLSAIACYEETTAPSTIKRKDQTRTATVTAVPKKGVPLTTVQKKIDNIIEENIVLDDGIQFATTGDFSEMLEMGKGFIVIIIMAMLLVFAVMASQFESLKDPFIIYFTIPFSFIGVAAIYAMTGQPLSMMSVLGVLMLVGVIVNNGIVLVDAANSLRKQGLSLEEACVESARSRLRPIMMSTLTTLISLIPMALFPSEGAIMIQPINLTVLGGLGFGTMMTVTIMPAVYYAFNAKSEKHRNC